MAHPSSAGGRQPMELVENFWTAPQAPYNVVPATHDTHAWRSKIPRPASALYMLGSG
eukprot:CAMPEP_0170328136 /NCGR_PEP_ID=MMETSP0116_2-20130129/64967_1 /TAXON_ID=400756 /ORGANISM="Durinskia baltica, Strain CSIRO CS-38" /LENGTH=56 /DNA_ID=CAMNT_0010581237 /DNA_START=378 /DNA_END=548 /DNA_ORIENTATION=-